MKTIIGFDNWVGGAPHFTRLLPALEKRGYSLILIHIGSWGHDKNRKAEEYIDTLLVRDVKYYKQKSLKAILLQEKPEAVLFLSTRAFVHQAFNRYAHQLKIPTIHLYHGLLSIQNIDRNSKFNYKVNYKQQIAIAIMRLRKNIAKIFPVYCRALIATHGNFQDWFWFIKEIGIKITSKTHKSKAAPDTATTIGCVYTSADVSHMVSTYRIPEDKVYIVGNPDLIHFGLSKYDLCAGINIGKESANDIIYIDTLLLDAGIVFNSEDDYVRHISMINDSIKAQGFHFVMKLHPGNNRTEVPNRLRRLGIELCENAVFVSRVNTAVAIISMPSSAAMIPALIGRPIFLDQCGKMASMQYGFAITTYPRTRFLTDIHKLRHLLQQEQEELDHERVIAWIKKNVGPLPAEQMPERVAAAVVNIIMDKPKVNM